MMRAGRGAGRKVPKNMRLLPLPPYSPELNPMENIGEELREKSFCGRRRSINEMLMGN